MEKTSTTNAAGKRSSSGARDAIAILTADHDNVKQLFKKYESTRESATSEERASLAAEICAELTVHAQVEEEIFYPAVRESIEDEDLMDESEVEHSIAKDLIAQIAESDPDDDLYDAKVKVLSEYIDHHVKEEEGEMFPKAKKAKLDLAVLGVEMEERKEELRVEIVGEAVEPQLSSRS